MIKAKCINKVGMGLCEEGKTYWLVIVKQMPIIGAFTTKYWDCVHVYAADNKDAWICNINLEELETYFEFI